PPRIDVDRFMGAWYVVAGIFTPFERCAHNAVEFYVRDGDGSIETRYRFRLGAFDGPYLELRSRAFVEDPASGSRWGMQFVPPFRADYRILQVDAGYRFTIVGREARDLVWIMSRTPELSDLRLGRALSFLDRIGYDIDRVRRVPHRWSR
ncbi:MAG: lipocalin family protein, partial [Pseudomonadales bacterium]|nr:lipocalin family protein [Pseudomonadales bacterium]